MSDSIPTVPLPLPSDEKRGYLNVRGRDIYTTFYLPKQANVRLAVACAEPFGEEKRASARMFVRLARTLAGAGCAVARFDFSGTGDSQFPQDGTSWKDWSDELCTVLKKLAETTRAQKTVLIGARAGALTAALAAQKDAPNCLLLLEPLLGGADMMRELRRREQLKAMEMSLGASRDDGEEFAAVFVSRQMAADIESTDLLSLCSSLPDSCLIQLLRVSALSNFPAAWQPLAAVITARTKDQAKIIRDKPFWGQTEYFESDRVLKEVQELLEIRPSLEKETC